MNSHLKTGLGLLMGVAVVVGIFVWNERGTRIINTYMNEVRPHVQASDAFQGRFIG